MECHSLLRLCVCFKRPSLILAISLFALAITSTSVYSNTVNVDDIHRLREQLKDHIASSNLSSLYVHILNFMTVPDISTSRVKIGEGGANIQLIKFPFQYETKYNQRGWSKLFRLNLSFASFNTPNVDAFNGATSVGRAMSASIGSGLRIPISNRVSSFFAFDFGISEFSDSTVYYSQDSIDHTAPIYEDIFFNWKTNAWSASLVVGLDYNINFGNAYKLDIVSLFNYNYIDSFNESNDFPGFSDNASTLSVHSNFSHPLNFSISGYPFFGIMHLGATSFVGSDSDILGFSSYLQYGYTLRMEFGNREKMIQDVQLGFQLLRGDNVQGYSILFDINF